MSNWRRRDFASHIVGQTKTRARRAGLEFNLTQEWVRRRLAKPCPKTGVVFQYELGSYRRTNPWSPSIDRIDSGKGYTKHNCRIVCWIYNCCRGVWDDDTVLEFAQAVAER